MNPGRDAPSTASRPAFVLVALFGLVILTGLLTLTWGSHAVPLGEVVDALRGADAGPSAVIVRELRLPRLVTAVLAGAALGVTGLQTQTVFRNPLADPYILGVSAGASLGAALLILVVGPTRSTFRVAGLGGAWLLILAAAAGAMAVMALMLVVAARVHDPVIVLVLGVMVAAVTGAATTLLVYFADADRTRAFVEWGLGSFTRTSWSDLRVMTPAVLVGLLWCLATAKPLDALLLGPEYATSLGLRVRLARTTILGGAAFTAAAVISFTGPIGFLGIAVPHLARGLTKSSSHRILLPASALLGAALAIACGLLAQVPSAPIVFPLNAATAIVGAPVVFVVLLRMRRPLSV